MSLGIYRVKPKVRIAKRISKGLTKLKPGERTKAYVGAGSRMAGSMVVDQYRGNQVEKVRNKMDTKFLARQERKQALKSQEHHQTGGAGTTEDRLDEYVLAIGKALARPGAKIAAKAAVAGTGKVAKIANKVGITKLASKVSGSKVGRFAAGKAHNVKVARRAQHIKNIRYTRTKPFRAGAKKVVKTIAGETAVRSAVDVASHAVSNPGKTAVDKAMGASDSPYSNVNRIRTAQDQSSAATRGVPSRGAGPAHSKSNAQMAMRRTEMRTPPSMSARQPTRQRTNVSASVIDTAANIFERHYLDEIIGAVGAVLTPQLKFAKNKIAKPIAKAIIKPPFRKEGVDEGTSGLAYAVEFGHIKPMKKFAKKASRQITSKAVAPAAERYAQHKEKSVEKWLGRPPLKTRLKALPAKIRAKLPSRTEGDLDEILATTAIGAGAVGGLAARRLIKRNKINRGIYAKKAQKHADKATDFESKARIGGAIRSGGRAYTRKRLAKKAIRIQRKIGRYPVDEGTLIGRAGEHEDDARYHNTKSKQWALFAKQADKEGKEASTGWGRGVNKLRGKAFTAIAKGHKREGYRAKTRLKARRLQKGLIGEEMLHSKISKFLTPKKHARDIKRGPGSGYITKQPYVRNEMAEGLLYTSPERWQAKANKQRAKSAKAQNTSDVFARRTRRGLEKKLARVQRKGERYGGIEKYGQNNKQKTSGKSTAQIVANELERRHNLGEMDADTRKKNVNKFYQRASNNPAATAHRAGADIRKKNVNKFYQRASNNPAATAHRAKAARQEESMDAETRKKNVNAFLKKRANNPAATAHRASADIRKKNVNAFLKKRANNPAAKAHRAKLEI